MTPTSSITRWSQRQGVSEQCIALLDRVIAGRISAFVSVPVLSETVHKVMMSEVAQLTGRDRAGIIGFLNKHPEVIGQLVQYPQALSRLSVVPLTVLPVDEVLLHDATRLAARHQLLTNDAMVVALMQRHSVGDLVTNDDDFSSVPGVRVWQPR